jgi:hypothetical protein
MSSTLYYIVLFTCTIVLFIYFVVRLIQRGSDTELLVLDAFGSILPRVLYCIIFQQDFA